MTEFTIVPGAVVSAILTESKEETLRTIAETYLAHGRGLSVNPNSYFLRFPDKPNSRVIALPCYLGGEVNAIGMKWIASFPDNIRTGLPRASAVLLINDYTTGYPVACLEAAGISAARTGASAALAAKELLGDVGPVGVSFVGAGVIAKTILDYLQPAGLDVADVLVHDLDASSAGHLAHYAAESFGVRATAGTLEEALDRRLVIFATTAAQPYVPAETTLRPDQVVLNISLRDLAPEVLLQSNNVVDDVDHCLTAQTSPHLAEQMSGARKFISGTLAELLEGTIDLDSAKAVVFSPFGLGVLDLALGNRVLREARTRGEAIVVADFIGDTRRW